MNRPTAQDVAPTLELARWSAPHPASPLSAPSPPLRLLIEAPAHPDPLEPTWCRRYRPLSDRIASAQQGGVLLVQALPHPARIASLPGESMGPTLLYAHSYCAIATLVRQHGWRPLVRKAGGTQAAFIVPRASRIADLADSHGARLLLPPQDDSATLLARAELRRRGVRGLRTRYLCYPEAVLAMLQAGLADMAVVDLQVALETGAAGARVIAVTQPIVGACLLASPEVSRPLALGVCESLMAMNTTHRDALAAMDVPAWVRSSATDYAPLLHALDACGAPGAQPAPCQSSADASRPGNSTSV